VQKSFVFQGEARRGVRSGQQSYCGPTAEKRTARIKQSTGWAARFFKERLHEARFQISEAPFKPCPDLWNPNRLTVSWLGHSTVLMNFFGFTVLTDPVLEKRVGASLRVATIGPKRVVAPALSFAELPPIDLILLSHAHMDHFDLPTLRRFGRQTRVVTARGTSDLLRFTRIKSARELGWGDRTTVITPAGQMEIEAFEVNHWGTRWRKDNFRGYNGYILSREGKKVVFGGDTAFTSKFRDLRPKGSFDIGCMPIGAYNPWIRTHCTPEEAISMANMAGIRHVVPIHHKTFLLGREPLGEPVERCHAALKGEEERLALREIGETAFFN
jgi:L-ascorbate metabolism protein UlaG (beta-lactamase superfamily)